MQKLLILLLFIGLVSCADTQMETLTIESAHFTRSCQDTIVLDTLPKLDTLIIE